MAGRRRGRLVMVASVGLVVREIGLWMVLVVVMGVPYLLAGEAFLCGEVWWHVLMIVILSPLVRCVLVWRRMRQGIVCM